MTMPRSLLQVLVALALVLGGIAACRPAADLARLPGTVPAPAGAVATGQVGPAAVPVAGQGVVNLVVHWPERDVRDFRAQLIPTSTDRIDFEAKTLAGSVAATASVTRSDATTTEATTSMTLDAATYDFGAKAYRSSTEIARANAARVQVVAGAEVSADLTLGPLFAPTITSFEPTSGSAGTTVTITGTNLKPAGVATPVVKFNGIAATVTAGTATSLTVTVPAGSTLGKIEVISDGISVTSTATFGIAPRLNAINPPLARVGATVYLEGEFDSTATVNFPGSVTAAATVLGLHRAKVVVPANTTAGNLTVTTGGVTTAGLPFRAPSFDLGLGNVFQAGYTQSDVARRYPTIVTARHQFGTIVIGNYLYIMGGDNGNLDSVERAAIDAAGNLGDFSTVAGVKLATARAVFGTAVVGNYLYVFGGYHSGYLNSVERAAIDGSGNLGNFATVNGVTLATGRQTFTSAVIGSYLYIFGGYNGGYLTNVERAPIDGAGNLGTFTSVPGLTLASDRSESGIEVIGNYVYLIGGGGPTNTVERAPIDGAGNLGNFATVGNVTLATARRTFQTAVVGNNLYVLGGVGAGVLNTVESAQIDGAGNLTTFAAVPGVTLTAPRGYFGHAVIGNFLYAFGGYNDSGLLTSVERVSLNSTGNLGNFGTVSGVTLATARAEFGSAVVGNYLYVFGGSGSDSSNNVERASIDAGGNLGAFATVAGVTLATGRHALGSAVVGNYLYVFGGGPYLSSVERASIDAGGNLGAFATVSGVTLATGRRYFSSAVVGNYLYVFGGTNGSILNNVERASIDASGNLGAFATVAGITLATARDGFGSAVVGNYLYCYGGNNGSFLNSVERASIDAGSNLGAFSTVAGVTLATARNAFDSAVLGNSIYVFGGAGASGKLNSVERASIDAGGNLGTFGAVSGVTLATAQTHSGSAVAGNYLLVFGGDIGSGFLNTVERAPLQ